MHRPKTHRRRAMAYCSRCLLNHAMRVVNLVMNLCGLAMIVYTLWLLKAWKQAVAELDATTSSFPTPWFIYTLLGVGIVVCLSAIIGHVISNSVNPIALSLHILFICLILFFQILVIVEVLFKIDWSSVISTYLEGNTKFVDMFSLHANICRLIGILTLAAQVNVLVLAVVLRALGPQPRNHCERAAVPEIRYSFLVMGGGSDSPPPGLPASAPPHSRADSNFEPALLVLRSADVRWTDA